MCCIYVDGWQRHELDDGNLFIVKLRERETHLNRHSTSSLRHYRRCMWHRGCRAGKRLLRENKIGVKWQFLRSTSSSPIPCSNCATKKNQTFHDRSSIPLWLASSVHSDDVPLREMPQTLFSGLSARYGPTRKWGKEKVKKPRPMTTMPQPTHFGFDAPTRPPKYDTGIRQKKLAISYPRRWINYNFIEELVKSHVIRLSIK